MKKHFIPFAASETAITAASELLTSMAFEICRSARGVDTASAWRVSQDLGLALREDIKLSSELFDESYDTDDCRLYFCELACGRVLDANDSPLKEAFYLRMALESCCLHAFGESLNFEERVA